jgi:hypothetical protein
VLLWAGVAVLTVDSLGRRPLLLAGVSSMVVALLALGGSNLVLSGSLETWTSVIALLVYVGAYQVPHSLPILAGHQRLLIILMPFGSHLSCLIKLGVEMLTMQSCNLATASQLQPLHCTIICNSWCWQLLLHSAHAMLLSLVSADYTLIVRPAHVQLAEIPAISCHHNICSGEFWANQLAHSRRGVSSCSERTCISFGHIDQFWLQFCGECL